MLSIIERINGILITILLLPVHTWVNCSINVTRGGQDTIYNPNVNGQCDAKYKANRIQSGICKCGQHKKYTFIGDEVESKCDSLANTGTLFWTLFFLACSYK